MILPLASHTSDAGALVAVATWASFIVLVVSVAAVLVQLSFAAGARGGGRSAPLVFLAGLVGLILLVPLLFVIFASVLSLVITLLIIAVLVLAARAPWPGAGWLAAWRSQYERTRFAKGALVSAIPAFPALVILLRLFAWGICEDDCDTDPGIDLVQALGFLAAALLACGLILRVVYRQAKPGEAQRSRDDRHSL